MADDEIGLSEAVEAGDLNLIAGWLEYRATLEEQAAGGSIQTTAALLQAAATYRLVVATRHRA